MGNRVLRSTLPMWNFHFVPDHHVLLDHQSIKELTHVVTDRGPLRHWLRVVGRSEEDRCECGSI